jgi:hypothetical protein
VTLLFVVSFSFSRRLRRVCLLFCFLVIFLQKKIMLFRQKMSDFVFVANVYKSRVSPSLHFFTLYLTQNSVVRFRFFGDRKFESWITKQTKKTKENKRIQEKKKLPPSFPPIILFVVCFFSLSY